MISGAPNLDAMLGNLQEDMDKQGVKTKQKGVCAACRYCPVQHTVTPAPCIGSKPIVGQVITALGHTWHPEHFTCADCNQVRCYTVLKLPLYMCCLQLAKF